MTHTHSLRRNFVGFAMMALVLALSLNASAQVAYNFERSTVPPIAPDDVPAVTGTGHNILTMDCLAAFNVMNSNNSGGAQISLTGSLGAIVFLGEAPGTPGWGTSVYGKNNIQGSPQI